jgi:hypothetical protein
VSEIAVCDESLLTLAAHGDGVRDTDGVELPADHALLLDGVLDDLTKIKDCMFISMFSSRLHIRFTHDGYCADSLASHLDV